MSFYDWGWAPRPSLTALRHQAKREAEQLRKKGRTLEPVVIAGRAITRTFWGNAWCKNLERYSDFANRLPRGRSYVRNGLVLHLAIEPGTIDALVRGSSLYETSVAITPVARKRWKAMCAELAGSIDSVVELLQGRISAAVMDRLCREGTGLFPTPSEIRLECSCPDFASMCKHVAAVLYGIGARLDERPELLFTLRQIDAGDLIASADGTASLTKRRPRADRLLERADLSELFGLDMTTASETVTDAPSRNRTPPARPAKASVKKAHGRKTPTSKPSAKSAKSAKKAKKAKKATAVRKRPRRRRMGTTWSTNSSRPEGSTAGMMLNPSAAPLTNQSSMASATCSGVPVKVR